MIIRKSGHFTYR